MVLDDVIGRRFVPGSIHAVDVSGCCALEYSTDTCERGFSRRRRFRRVLFCFVRLCPQTYTVNTFLTHRWVVMLNGAEVKTWLVSERQEKQNFVLSKADLL